MAAEQDIQSVAQILQKLPQQISTCEQMALVLIETKQEWTYQGRPSWPQSTLTSDHDRAKQVVATSCARASQLLDSIRRQISSVEAIRAWACVSQMQVLCQQCASSNISNLQREGGTFLCLINGGASTRFSDIFAIRLDPTDGILNGASRRPRCADLRA